MRTVAYSIAVVVATAMLLLLVVRATMPSSEWSPAPSKPVQPLDRYRHVERRKGQEPAPQVAARQETPENQPPKKSLIGTSAAKHPRSKDAVGPAKTQGANTFSWLGSQGGFRLLRKPEYDLDIEFGLGSGDDSIAAMCLQGLNLDQIAKNRDAITGIVTDPERSNYVRSEAAQALAREGSRESRSRLMEALVQEHEEEVRRSIRAALKVHAILSKQK